MTAKSRSANLWTLTTDVWNSELNFRSSQLRPRWISWPVSVSQKKALKKLAPFRDVSKQDFPPRFFTRREQLLGRHLEQRLRGLRLPRRLREPDHTHRHRRDRRQQSLRRIRSRSRVLLQVRTNFQQYKPWYASGKSSGLNQPFPIYHY